MIDLKPCPFCGGKPYLANVEMVGCAYVVCTDCRTQGNDMSKDRAISAWNTRAMPDAQVAVKPLEWTDERGGSYCWPQGLHYYVEGEGDDWYCACMVADSDIWDNHGFLSREAAKAAAQADYETRIRGALL